MIATQQDVSPLVVDAPPKTKGQMYEGIAFNFCKAATILLITLPFQKFALPLVAGAAAIFYLLAHFHGQRETRCILKMPLLIAVFWGSISIVSFYLFLRPPVGS
jgi:hypothetical protein